MSQLPEVVNLALSGRKVLVSQDLLSFDQRDIVRDQDNCSQMTDAVQAEWFYSGCGADPSHPF
ncbi:hypothetical protein DPPLL_17550 [Desulfofustis limnaeus]|uniref:Uncharacterized protein n=1 Tax=Desulfofustis limnaeus TaxID=2740163 RepID=A0ABM7W943_9BACT|nr:hypothetical protein DPPLL_17550 [Desulfofustis limnaeus]